MTKNSAARAVAVQIADCVNWQCEPMHKCSGMDIGPRADFIRERTKEALSMLMDWDDNRINDVAYHIGSVFAESGKVTVDDALGHMFDGMVDVWY